MKQLKYIYSGGDMGKKQSKMDLIQKKLHSEIIRKKWRIGDRLPSRSELASRFDCNTEMIDKAIALLAHEGFLEKNGKAHATVIRNTEQKLPVSLNAYAFIVPSAQHEAIRRIVQGFQDEANLLGRRVLTMTTGGDYHQEVELIRRLPEFDVRGAVVYPMMNDPQDQLLFVQELSTSPLPIVLAELSMIGMWATSVAADGFHAGYTVTRYLLDHGAKKIGFLSDRSWGIAMRERLRGYKWALNEAGIEGKDDFVLLEPSRNTNYENPLIEPTKLGETYLKKCKAIDAVVCTTDFLAAGLVLAATKIGISVPEKLKVIGIGDTQTLGDVAKKLTTYHIPFEEIGRASFRALEELEGNKKENVKEILLQGKLIIRESA